MSWDLSEYETVEERLVKFWNAYPDGRIETELIEATPARFIVFSKLYRTEADAKPWTTGLAFENITDRGVNSTSALENCETSSIGRALANAGFATKGKRASREEMEKVQRLKQERIIKVEKPGDPWTVETKVMPPTLEEALVQLNDGVMPEEIPTCPTHNKPCIPRNGNKNGKEWKHYKCPESWPNKCEFIVWMEIDKSGRWVAQRPRPTQGTI